MNILHTSLCIEGLTSQLLAHLLDIKDYENKITLGNKSTALSFSQKINLLIDIGALDKEKRTKFEKFMSIRNQFMHNLDADTYEKCVGYIDGCKNWLLKTYPQDSSDEVEIQLQNAIRSLGIDVMKYTMDITNPVVAKAAKRAENQVYKKMLKVFTDSVQELREDLDNNPELYGENIGTHVHNVLYILVEKNSKDMKYEM